MGFVGLAHQSVHDPDRLIEPRGVPTQPFQFHHRISLAWVLHWLTDGNSHQPLRDWQIMLREETRKWKSRQQNELVKPLHVAAWKIRVRIGREIGDGGNGSQIQPGYLREIALVLNLVV